VIKSLTGDIIPGRLSPDVAPVGARMAKMLLADYPFSKAHEVQMTVVISSEPHLEVENICN